MAWVIYNQFKVSQLDGTSPNTPIDFDSDKIHLMLLDSGSTIDQTDEDLADALVGGSDSEVSGTNYARKVISSVTVVSSAGTVTVDGNDPTAFAQSASGFSDALYAILYKGDNSVPASDTAASSPLIASYTFASSQNNVSGSLTLQFSAAGIFTLA